MSEYEDYREGVDGLAAAGFIPHPNPDDVCRVAPHLSQKTAESLLVASRGCGRVRYYFVGPPLYVRGALQLYAIDWGGGAKRERGVLYRAYATRTPESFVAHPRGLPPTDSPALRGGWEFAEAATDHAEIYWPERLHWDTSVSVLHGRILGTWMPSPFTGYASFMAWLSSDARALSSDDEPLSELINDAIIAVSDHPPSMDEMRGDGPVYLAVYCGDCGGGIVAGRCVYCDYDYTHVISYPDHEWSNTLPAKIGKLVRHKFKYDPIEARKWEHRQWANSGHCPIRPDTEQRQRIIDLGG